MCHKLDFAIQQNSELQINYCRLRCMKYIQKVFLSIFPCEICFSISSTGKHIRVWTRFFTAVLYRNPSFHSAHSAPLPSLTHPHTLTCSFSSHLGLDLHKVISKTNCDVICRLFQPTTHRISSWYFFYALLYIWLGFLKASV